MTALPRYIPPALAALVARTCVLLDDIGEWGNAIERHIALEELGVAYAQQLRNAMTEAEVARAANQPRRR
ncbi:MAG TPA: hypothetical protein VFN09_06645 [Rhodanobacteraceae bacterium]|nr:hypothetical protein [Rhodanobacteraceae bacterium]